MIRKGFVSTLRGEWIPLKDIIKFKVSRNDEDDFFVMAMSSEGDLLIIEENFVNRLYAQKYLDDMFNDNM